MKIIAFTGAGISKESGIDTFMEQPQVRDNLHRHIAIHYPQRYRDTIKQIKHQIDQAKPNDAHIALSEYGIDIITMNIDTLHQQAGSTPLCLHGSMPSDEELPYCDQLIGKPVLYGDQAPNYQLAYEKVSALKPGDVLLVIGASMATAISSSLQQIALYNQVQVIQIQDHAATKTREVLKQLCR